MKTPPWLMGAVLLFWGWENNMLILGALMAAALEGSRLTRTRWEFAVADLNRISDLCAALFLGIGLLLYSTEDRLIFLFRLAQWLPICCFPLMLVQTYGSSEKMPLSVFWWLLRRSPNSVTARKSYNVSYCYFAICLLAASSSTRAISAMTMINRYFYAGVTVLVAWALIGVRPRRVSQVVWVVLLALAAVAGQFSHKQLQKMQNAMEGALGTWISNFLHPSISNRECRTRIGSPGEISLSGKIVLRLHPEPGGLVPALLREATWDAYKKETWLASNNDFSTPRNGRDDNITLLPTNMLSSELEIARYYENGDGILDLPQGTCEIGHFNILPALVQTNRLGVIKFESGPGLLIMRAVFGPGRAIDAPPSDRDLLVPKDEKAVLDRIIAELKLDKMPTDRQKIRAIESYFAKNFVYSLDIPRGPGRTNLITPLGYFLTRTHAGHCEYFATATVLLLREAGVPARYATGYAIPESAHSGDTYLVRERHAHAWALAYHGDPGMWEQIDTTPAEWDKAAEAQPSWWEPASDALSNVYFQFSKWRWSKTSYARYASWLIVPLILYLIGRILFGQRPPRPAAPKDDGVPRHWPGLDSELFLINRQLAASQLSRQPNEPLRAWQLRLENAFPESERLRRIFHLHRSLRFDPLGLEETERAALRDEAQQWMADFSAKAELAKQAAATAPRPARG